MLRMMRAPAEATVPLDRAAPGGELDWSCPPESAVHPLLLAVFVALDAVGVRWCVLRGEAELAAPTGDVDLLVAPADLDRTRRALAALRFVELPTWGHGSHLFFLSYHRATDRWIELDVVTELAFGRHFALQTRAELGCLAQRRRVGPYYALAPDDAFWTLLLHCLLDKGMVAPHHALRLQHLAGVARSDGPLARFVASLCPGDWQPAQVMAFARGGDWEALAGKAARLVRAWRRRDLAGVWQRLLTRAALRRLDRLPVPKRRGLDVALLGPDGAGKSTLATALQRSFHLPARTVYMGLWQDRQAGGGMKGLRVPGVDLGRHLLTVWRRYLVARYYRALGRLVIYDRYTYDALLALAAPPQRLTWRGRAYFWLLAHAIPAPGLALVLDAPGAVMHARKGEYTPEQLEAQRRRFLLLRDRIPHVAVVDASQPPEVVRAEVMHRVWRSFAAQWRRY